MNLDLHRLEVLCKVIETRSFTKAGEIMLISQPTVSEHIRYLEEMIGEKLINRLGREAVPTQAGLLLYEYAKKMLDLKVKTIQAIQEFCGSMTGNLKIGASTIPGTYILPSLLGRFRKGCPSIMTTLFIAGSRAVVNMLLEGQIELGFTGAYWHDVKLHWEEMWQDTLVLAVSSSDPLSLHREITIEDLRKVPLILREKGSGTRKITEEILHNAGLEPEHLNIVAELGSTEAVKEGIKAGLGTSIISLRAIEDDIQKKRIVAISVKSLNFLRPFYLVVHRKKHLSPLAKRFKDFVVEFSRSSGQ